MVSLPVWPASDTETSSTVDQYPGDARQAIRLAQQDTVRQPGGVGDVVGAMADERQPSRCLGQMSFDETEAATLVLLTATAGWGPDGVRPKVHDVSYGC